MGEIKQTNFRIDSDTADRFRTFCEEAGLNQAQGFDHIMTVMEMDKAKSIVPERMTEIEEFERHTKAMLSAYLGSLEIAKSTEERVLEQFRAKIESKDETIIQLQNRLKEQMDLVIEARNESMELINEKMAAEEERKAAVERMKSAETAAADKEKIANMLQIKLAEAEEKLEGYPEVKADAARLAEDLAAERRKCQDLQKESEIAQERAEREFERKINSLQAEIVSIKKDAEIAQERAVATVQKAADKELGELRIELAREKTAWAQKDNQVSRLEEKNEKLEEMVLELRYKIATLVAKQISDNEAKNEAKNDAEKDS